MSIARAAGAFVMEPEATRPHSGLQLEISGVATASALPVDCTT